MTDIEYFNKYTLNLAYNIVEYVPPEIIIKEYLSGHSYPLDLRLAITYYMMPDKRLPKNLVEMIEKLLCSR